MLSVPFRRDLVIRSVGLGLLAVAAACLDALSHGPATRGVAGGLAALEALVGFISASLGTTLLLLGRHIHDQVMISARWRQVRPVATVGHNPQSVDVVPVSDSVFGTRVRMHEQAVNHQTA